MSILNLETENILLSLEKHVLWLTLNRPDSSNAYSEQMIVDLVKVLHQVNLEKDVRCVVITGAGKNFCAGGDIKAMKNKTGMFAGDADELRIRYQQGIQQISIGMESLSKPTIAMVQGAAIGAGLDLACMCDIRYCSDKALFAESFAKLGLVPGDGGSFFLQRVVGYSQAMEMSLTCDTYNSEQALEMGLVSKVITLEGLNEEVKHIAEKIASLAPIAIQKTKDAIKQAYFSELSENLDLVASYQSICQRSKDHFIALDSFLTKTRPTFTGE